ncbi:MAG TPA: NosD domain-containing protein [Solirubrobacteraceae bacterium]|jgi:nitrous oxidase accessory protein NosD
MAGDRLRKLTLFVIALMATVLGGCGAAHGSRLATVCRWFASPNGADRARGSAAAPFRSVQRLVNRLRPGQTGCLLSGTYPGNVSFYRGGRRRRPITLRSAPGAHATIEGRIYIARSANHVNVDHLRLDGRNDQDLPSPTVDSAYDQFVDDDVTNDHSAICFSLGSGGGYGQAVDALIEHDRIHGCGVLPPTNQEHGIYVANSIGARIIDNVIYDNADRGIQLYWNAQRTTIAGNVIDHNGEGIIISGDYGFASSHNLIIDNAITNSTMRADVESYWPDPAHKGIGNLVVGNCIDGGRLGIDHDSGGFTARRNRYVNPLYADPAVGNYIMRASSPCASVLARAAANAASLSRPSAH